MPSLCTFSLQAVPLQPYGQQVSVACLLYVLFHYKRSRCNHTDNRSQWRAFFMYFFTTSGPVATIRTTGLSGVPSLCSFSLQAVPLQPYGQQVSVACLLYVVFHYKRSRCNHTDNRSQWRAFFMYFFTTSGPVATIRTTGLSGVPSLCSFSLQAVPLQPYGQQVSVACLLYVLFHYKRSRCNHTDNRSQWRAFFMYFFTTSGPVATKRTTGLSGVPSLCSFSLQAVPLQPYGQQVSVACLLYVVFHYKRSRCNHTDNRSQWCAFFM